MSRSDLPAGFAARGGCTGFDDGFAARVAEHMLTTLAAARRSGRGPAGAPDRGGLRGRSAALVAGAAGGGVGRGGARRGRVAGLSLIHI